MIKSCFQQLHKYTNIEINIERYKQTDEPTFMNEGTNEMNGTNE